jgi:hypothetical protein
MPPLRGARAVKLRGRRRRRSDLGPPLADGALPTAWLKEDLSLAYVHALAMSVGVTVDIPLRDINGCDVLFRAQDTRQADGTQLSVQLKCTVDRLNRVGGGSELSFPLDQKDYRHLIKTPAHPPRLLVVVEAPDNSPRRWAKVSPRELLVLASAWYVSLAGEPDIPDAQASKTVRLPAHQRFTPAALLANMRSCP